MGRRGGNKGKTEAKPSAPDGDSNTAQTEKQQKPPQPKGKRSGKKDKKNQGKTAAELKLESRAHLDPNANLDEILAANVVAPAPKKKKGVSKKVDKPVAPPAASPADEQNKPPAPAAGNDEEGHKKKRRQRKKKNKNNNTDAGQPQPDKKKRQPLDDLDENCSTPGSSEILDIPHDIAPVEEEDFDDDDQHHHHSDDGTEEDFSDNDNERAKEYRKGGYHPVYTGELYNQRYRVVQKLGWGYFSTVWLVWDYKTEKFYAMKVQKSAEHYRDAAFDEIKLLSQIMAADPEGQMCCARMVDSFEHRGPHGLHVVMVFGILGENLLKLIERYEHRGIPIPIVKSIARQMLIGLHHIHSINILHTDIKPENVLLSQPKHKVFRVLRKYKPPALSEHASLMEKDVSMMTKSQRRRYNAKKRRMQANGQAAPDAEATAKSEPGEKPKPKCIPKEDAAPAISDDSGSETDPEWEVNRFHNVCLADFGNGCWTHRQFTDEVQTRQYRSPEVIIGSGYSTPIDLWSTACMIFELLTGEFLFDPKSRDDYSRDEDHLALMMELLGDMPEEMSRGDGKFRAQYFNSAGELRHIKNLHRASLADVLRKRYHFTWKKAREIEEFLLPMLALDPNERFTAQEMLTEFEDFFEVQEDDYSPLCYVSNEDEEEAEDRDADEEEDEQTLEEWYASIPQLRPDELERRGLTLEDVKNAIGGRMTEDVAKREAIMELLDEMQVRDPCDEEDEEHDPREPIDGDEEEEEEEERNGSTMEEDD